MFWLTCAGLTELATAAETVGADGVLPGVQASTSVSNELTDFPPAAPLMTTRTRAVVVAPNDTVRLTRLLPVTEPSVIQAVPFQACTSKAVTPRCVNVSVSLGSTGLRLLSCAL